MPRPPKAKTAYELLERVCDHIREEPKRYNQCDWGLTGRAALKEYGSEGVPACGTVACRAGWIVALHDGHPALKKGPAHVQGRATQLLGASPDDVYDLFSGDALDSLSRTTSGYVREGVAGIRRFMKRHRTQLQKRTLKGV